MNQLERRAGFDSHPACENWNIGGPLGIGAETICSLYIILSFQIPGCNHCCYCAVISITRKNSESVYNYHTLTAFPYNTCNCTVSTVLISTSDTKTYVVPLVSTMHSCQIHNPCLLKWKSQTSPEQVKSPQKGLKLLWLPIDYLNPFRSSMKWSLRQRVEVGAGTLWFPMVRGTFRENGIVGKSEMVQLDVRCDVCKCGNVSNRAKRGVKSGSHELFFFHKIWKMMWCIWHDITLYCASSVVKPLISADGLKVWWIRDGV